MVNILIADDHEVIHNGIRDILRSHKRYNIVGHAFNGEDAIIKALSIKPDIIFMDISMPVLNGIEATKEIRIKQPGIKIIALSQHEEKEYVYQFLKSGGDGYLLKNSKKKEFIDAIESVLSNRRYLSQDIADQLVTDSLLKSGGMDEQVQIHLTRREIEIIQQIANDKSNQEIADELNISLRTVETHRRNLMQKLKINSVVALMKYATIHNLINFQKS